MIQQSQKNCSSKIRGLYAILDVPHPSGLDIRLLAQALLGQHPHPFGARVLQLRAKYATTEERISLLKQIAPLCQASDTTLIVNDDIEAALAMAELVDGVHLGQADIASWLEQSSLQLLRERAKQNGCHSWMIGVSTHSLEQLTKAMDQGADYVGFGPIWPTTSKVNPEVAVGLENLEKACRLASCPIVAIGGIRLATVKQVMKTGASAIAVISAISAPCFEEIQKQVYDFAQEIAAESRYFQ